MDTVSDLSFVIALLEAVEGRKVFSIPDGSFFIKDF